MEAGHASSLAPSVSASLLVPVLLSKEANHAQAREVLGISSERKKNKIGNVRLVSEHIDLIVICAHLPLTGGRQGP